MSSQEGPGVLAPYPSFLTPQPPLCSKTAGPKPFSSNPHPRLKAPTSSCHLSHELDPPEMPTGATGNTGQNARRLWGTSLHVRGLTGQWKQEIPQSTATMTSKYFLKASGHEAATCEDTASRVTLGRGWVWSPRLQVPSPPRGCFPPPRSPRRRSDNAATPTTGGYEATARFRFRGKRIRREARIHWAVGPFPRRLAEASGHPSPQARENPTSLVTGAGRARSLREHKNQGRIRTQTRRQSRSLSLSHPQAARNLESTLAPALLYSPSTSSTPTRKCREPSHSGCGGRKTNLKPYGVDAQKARSGSRYWDQKVHTTFPTSPRAAPLESARYISHKPSRRFLRKCRLHFPQVLAPFL